MFVTEQQYAVRPIRSGAILTTSYVAGTVIGVPSATSANLKLNDQVDELNYLALEVDYVHGSLTTAEIKVECSDDNVTYYQLSTGSISSGTDTISPGVLSLATTDGSFYIDVNAEFLKGGPLKTKFIKVSAKGTGTLTNSLMTIWGVIGVG